MKEIKGYWYKNSPCGQTVSVLIKDEEAMRDNLMKEMSGWTVEDAVRRFNKRLEVFGYRIAETEHWTADPYC